VALCAAPGGGAARRPTVRPTALSHAWRRWGVSRRKARRVVSKVEWHQGELYPRVGFIVTNLARPAKRVVKFYNGRGTAEQHIKIL
jgi:Transposase DDE domain group 1